MSKLEGFVDITNEIITARNRLRIPTEVEIGGASYPVFNPRRVWVYKHSNQLDEAYLDLEVDALRNTPKPVIEATGGTMLGRRKLAGERRDEVAPLVEFRNIINLDECDLVHGDGSPYPDDLSFYSWMDREYFGRLAISSTRWIIPDGWAQRPEIELDRWRQELKRFDREDTAPIGIAHFGIGPKGSPHIAYMTGDFVPEDIASYVETDEPTRVANSPTGDPRDYPQFGYTMGPKLPILGSEVVFFAAKGRKKADNVAGVLLGDFDQFRPASMVLLNENVTVLLDQKAADGVFERLNY